MLRRLLNGVDFFEEVSLESPRKTQDEQVTSETSWNATRRKEVDEWRLEPEGETETRETKVSWNGVEGVPGYPDSEGHHERGASEDFQKGKRIARGRR